MNFLTQKKKIELDSTESELYLKITFIVNVEDNRSPFTQFGRELNFYLIT